MLAKRQREAISKVLSHDYIRHVNKHGMSIPSGKSHYMSSWTYERIKQRNERNKDARNT